MLPVRELTVECYGRKRSNGEPEKMVGEECDVGPITDSNNIDHSCTGDNDHGTRCCLSR